jgi:hypothetical protein
MTVGLLTQPRYRKSDPQNNEQHEIKRLKAQILELEKVTATQVQLIEILKSVPGHQGVTRKDAKPKTVPKRDKTKSGEQLNNGAQRESEVCGKRVEGDHPNPEKLEEKLQ